MCVCVFVREREREREFSSTTLTLQFPHDEGAIVHIAVKGKNYRLVGFLRKGPRKQM